MPFWKFFRKGQDGHVLLMQPSRIPHRISKTLFVLGSHEYLKRLEGKLERAYSLMLKYSEITARYVHVVIMWCACECGQKSSHTNSLLIKSHMLTLVFPYIFRKNAKSSVISCHQEVPNSIDCCLVPIKNSTIPMILKWN